MAVVMAILLPGCSASKEPPMATLTAEKESGVNPYKAEYWQEQDGFMHYLEPGYTSQVGIDVSRWNGEIDWEEVADSQIEFAIIRIGLRRYNSGTTEMDPMFEANIEAAQAAGLKVGVYFYTQAISKQEAEEEARLTVEWLKGRELDLPVYCDTEKPADVIARMNSMSNDQLTENAVIFCETIEEAGYQAGIYTNLKWMRRRLNYDDLKKYDIWLAQYTDEPASDMYFDMWQYTNGAVIDGINESVDLNIRITKEQ